MKPKSLLFSIVLALGLSTTSCITYRYHHRPPRKEIPPGHAKKKHRKKPAKFEAPVHYAPKHHYK